MERMNELGFYTLAGAPRSPRDLISEVRHAEELGVGSAFISERFNIKEASTLSGAAGAVSSEIGIATAATNHNTRHPMVAAAYAMTMHRLTSGRFSLGLGRGIGPMFDAYGLPRIKTDYDEHVPMTFTAFGPNSLALGGRAFDAVVLHTFFTDETTSRCVESVKRAAEEAGRDPAEVRVWSCFATIGDRLPEAVRLKKTVGRMATYLQAYGDLMVRTNDWDPEVLRRFASDEFVAGFKGALDTTATTTELDHVATLIPDEWLAPAATGSPEQCVEKIHGQFELGCDGVILHGASPSELEPIVTAYRNVRPAGRFDGLSANPAGC